MEPDDVLPLGHALYSFPWPEFGHVRLWRTQGQELKPAISRPGLVETSILVPILFHVLSVDQENSGTDGDVRRFWWICVDLDRRCYLNGALSVALCTCIHSNSCWIRRGESM
jgi:hypothetical protein